MEKDDRIFVAGSRGMVGSAIVNELKYHGYTDIITPNREDVNLLYQAQVGKFFSDNNIDYVFLAAARVGGIEANMRNPADFLYENLQIQNNVIESAMCFGVKKMCMLGSSCMYPVDCKQPMKEEYLGTGPLEPTNKSYALAKLVGLHLAQSYRTEHKFNVIYPIPCNLYGKNDHYNPLKSHVMAALVKKFVDEDRNDSPISNKVVTLWGTGKARREFLNVSDAARAFVVLMNCYDSPEPINVGSGFDMSIQALALMIMDRVCKDYDIDIIWDTTKPDGMSRKLLDVSKIQNLGFSPKIGLDIGIEQMIQQYRESEECRKK